jgi:hypothetical protein
MGGKKLLLKHAAMGLKGFRKVNHIIKSYVRNEIFQDTA